MTAQVVDLGTAVEQVFSHAENDVLFRENHRVHTGDLAILYGVPTKRLNEQVMRNKKRFPSDFMSRLSAEEVNV